MPAYAYAITIKREAQTVKVQREVDLEDDFLLTISKLRKYGIKDDDTFYISQKERGPLGLPCQVLIITSKRLETEEELKLRVAKEESYMEEYTKRQVERGTKRKNRLQI